MKGFRIFILSFLFITSVMGDEFLQLDYLVEEALQKSPEILAGKDTYNASVYAIPQAKSLPNPIIGIGMRNEQPTTSMDNEMMSNVGVMFKQAIPYPAKLSKKGDIAEIISDKAFWKFESTQRNVVKELKQAFFDLWFSHHQRDVLKEMKEIFKDLESAARIRYEVGEGILKDVLRVQVEISRIEEKLLLVNAEIERTEAKINALLGRPTSFKLGVPEDITAFHIEVTLEELENTAKENSPMIMMANLQREAAEEKLRLAKLDYAPDIMVEGAWMFREDFEDVWEAKVGFEVPLYFAKKENKAVKEKSLMFTSAKSELFGVEEKVLSKIRALFEQAKTSWNLVQLYETAIIPQSTSSLESARSAYSVGKTDFDSVLESALVLLMYKIEDLREVSSNRKYIAELEEIVGTSIKSELQNPNSKIEVELQ